MKARVLLAAVICSVSMVGCSMGNNASEPAAVITPKPVQTAVPTVEATPEPVETETPTPTPTKEAKPKPTKAPKPKPTMPAKPKPAMPEKNSEFASFEETYQVVTDCGFDSIFVDFTERSGRCSDLCFECVWEDKVDCGSYYEVPCVLEEYVYLNTDRYVPGDSIDICKNRFTDDWVTITLQADGETWREEGAIPYPEEYVVNSDSRLMFKYGSYDFPNVPFYRGTIRVNKGTEVGYFGDPEYTIETIEDDNYGWINGAYFEKDGHVSSLIFYGD